MRRFRGLRALALAGLLGLASAPALAEEEGVAAGKPAPAVELPATQVAKVLTDKKDTKTLSLKDFEGKKNVVLFFFPKAMTKG